MGFGDFIGGLGSTLNPTGAGDVIGGALSPGRRRSESEPKGAKIDPASWMYGTPGASPTPDEPEEIPNPEYEAWLEETRKNPLAILTNPAPPPKTIPNPEYVPGASGLETYNNATRDIAGGYGERLTGMGGGLYDTGSGLIEEGRAAFGADPNRLVYDPALEGAADASRNMGDAGARLMALSDANASSAAEALLRRGTADAANQNLALAVSGRGLGGGAAARRAAMSQNALLFGRMTPELAALRAQEEQANMQRQAAAASAAAGVYGAQGQNNLAAGGYYTGATGQAEGLSNQRGTALIGAGTGAMATGGQLVGTGGQTELTGQQIIGGANEAQLNANVAKEQNKTTRRGQDRALQGTEYQTEGQNKAAIIGGVAALGAGLIGMSDERAKKNIKPLAGIFARSADSVSSEDVAETKRPAAPSMAEKFKLDLFGEDKPNPPAPASPYVEQDTFRGPDGAAYPLVMNPRRRPTPEQAQATIAKAPPFSYDYKDPERHGEGKQIGQMAQDLEKTPAGAAAVVRMPDGMRAVDKGELTSINTAALYGVQKRQDNIEEQLRKLREGFGFTPGAPDTDALDESYAAERARR